MTTSGVSPGPGGFPGRAFFWPELTPKPLPLEKTSSGSMTPGQPPRGLHTEKPPAPEAVTSGDGDSGWTHLEGRHVYSYPRTVTDSPTPLSPRIPSARMELKAEEEEVGGVQPVSIQAFASSSTLHGLAHIFSYERLSLKRALWALCFLGSLAVLLCVCTERVQYYFHYHHVTKLDEVAASQLTFPAVTLCNLNEFRFSQVSKNDLYHAGELLALLNNRWAASTHPCSQTPEGVLPL